MMIRKESNINNPTVAGTTDTERASPPRTLDLTVPVAVPVPAPHDWVHICAVSSVLPGRGIAALVGDAQVAIFKLTKDLAQKEQDHEWCAVGNMDPLTGAPVMARGLVGSTGTDPLCVFYVASPLHKERYNLRTGYCLDHPVARLPVYPVRVEDDMIYVASVSQDSGQMVTPQ